MPKIPRHQFHWHRFSAKVGASPAVESVFRAPRRPLDPDGAIAADDEIRDRERAIWFAGAAFYVVLSAIPFLARVLPSFPGFVVPEALAGPWQLGAGAVGIAIGAVLLVCGWRNVPTLPWLPLAFGLAVALIAVGVLAAPKYAPELLGLFVMPAIAASFYLPSRTAAPFLAAILGVFAAVAIYNRDDPYDVVVAGAMAVFLIGSSAVMALARARIQQGIELNVEVAGRDPLTGAANLRVLRQRLDDEIRRAKRRELPVTLVMLDLDDFGEVNERFSHTLGDAVLVACARAMERVIRKDELLARRGDDEFAVVAVGESGEELRTLLDRLRHAVMVERQRLCPDVTPTVSIGHATWRRGESATAMVRRADSALHVGRMLGPEDT